ncbi:hypothetical protein AB0M11_37855 [Streptomyces sp. NPDC051987]|uniref:hypothetical protein n=1 Tax=Streptomyces sp. NPDC051987 TaxID=3155808 RepID=UPI0034146239
MIEQGYNDFLFSSRELSSFELEIGAAKTEAEVMSILQHYDLSEKDFPDGMVPGLPPEQFPTS